jgi:hypothetical protein
MKAPSSNLLVKVAVPVVLASAVVVGVKSCSGGNQTAAPHTASNVALEGPVAGRSQALGIEGDTPQDTLRTVVGNFRKVQDRLDTLADDNKSSATKIKP